MPKINKVWVKFFASYVVIILLANLILGMAASVFIQKQMFQSVEEQLINSGQEIIAAIEIVGSDQLNPSYMRLLTANYDGEMYLTDPEGVVVASSLGRENVGMKLSDDVMKEVRNGQRVSREWKLPGQEERVITVITPVVQQGRLTGTVVLAAPIKGVELAVDAVRSQVIRASVIALLLGMLVSMAVSFSMTAQIREITRGISRFAREELDYRIPIMTHDELGEIATGFNEMAEQISNNVERRRALLAGVSHEVRTPLTTIRGYVEALSDRVIPPEKLDETLDLIHEETIFMETMVSDLIDLSRLESDQFKLNLKDTNIAVIAEKVIQKLSWFASLKNDQIELNCSEETIVLADEVRIEQLLTNLVKNAIQFTSNGQAQIFIDKVENNAVIRIRDNGIGIKEDQLSLIFDSFFKADPARSKTTTESGLGLAIVRQIVKLHNGSIHVESKVEEGTTFVVTLPLYVTG